MCLTSSDIISVIGICVNVVVTIGIFLIVRLIFNRIKGPRLSIFNYNEETIRSSILLEHPDGMQIASDIIPKPRWFISVSFEMLNIGDTISKFYYHGIMELHDLIDNTGKPMKSKSRINNPIVLKPGEFPDSAYTSFGFIFEDLDAFKWEKATIYIEGYYFDHKSNEKPIKIDSQIISNPNPITQLDAYNLERIKAYKEQQQQQQLLTKKSKT
ncbi:MAG: hypothetical protein ACFFDW_14740 [Candidatus Thorarchaeota archaeon]